MMQQQAATVEAGAVAGAMATAPEEALTANTANIHIMIKIQQSTRLSTRLSTR